MSAYDDAKIPPGRRQFHQFECRWRPNTDFSPVASSMPGDLTQWWFDRMRLWIMHVADGEPAGSPIASVRYGIFDDGLAAFAWRLGNPGTAELTPTRPEVTRVLTGPAELLTPDVAMMVCHTGLPTAIGPRPGEFSVGGTALPPVATGTLSHMLAETTSELDYTAVRSPGLTWLVAAALRDRARPLVVQLPDIEIAQSPAGGRQAALLWGLRRTISPLLSGLDGRQPDVRDWSFSTSGGKGMRRSHRALVTRPSSVHPISTRSPQPTMTASRDFSFALTASGEARDLLSGCGRTSPGTYTWMTEFRSPTGPLKTCSRRACSPHPGESHVPAVTGPGGCREPTARTVSSGWRG